ncbi:MAG TPA: Smr/MutS family protein [Polyangiaceae bacterium]|jgi:DNA-nicking Smr family endonuclease|nr:Smr/MutS family protein [Polyangiaceae bacterium]
MSGKKKDKAGNSPFEALRPLKEKMTRKEAEARAAAAGGGKAGAPAPKPAPARHAVSAPQDQEDDAMLLRRLFAGVEPLDRTRGRTSAQTLEPSAEARHAAAWGPSKAREEADAVHEHLRALVEGRTKFEVADDGRRVEGRRIDIPHDAVRDLRRGRFPIDGRLDMHGMSIVDARAELESFLRATRARGERCVLVIHGKGSHSPGGSGILRGEIAAWLSQGPASEHIAAFATAQGDDGGEGAVYVMLRR